METNTQSATPSNEVAQLIAEANAYASSVSETLTEQNIQLLDLYGELIDQTLVAMTELYDLLVSDSEEEGAEMADFKENILEPLHQKVAEVNQAVTASANQKPQPVQPPADNAGDNLKTAYWQSMIWGVQNNITAHQQFQTILQATSVQTISTILSLVPAAISSRIERQQG